VKVEIVRRILSTIFATITFGSLLGFILTTDAAFAWAAVCFGVGVVVFNTPAAEVSTIRISEHVLTEYEKNLFDYPQDHMPVYMETIEGIGTLVVCSCSAKVFPDVWIEEHWTGDTGLMANYIALRKGHRGENE
jgi:hypothetical protein